MKRTISLLSILAFVLAFSGNVFAQSQNVSATATIMSQLTFNKTADLAFGKIPSNFSSVSITSDASGNATENNTGTGSSLGEVEIQTGTTSSALSITVNNPTTLESSTTPSSIGFNPDYIGQDGTDLSTASNAAVSTSDSDGDGNYSYTVYLGGSLDDPGTNNSDASFDSEQHTGTITINVDYQ